VLDPNPPNREDPAKMAPDIHIPVCPRQLQQNPPLHSIPPVDKRPEPYSTPKFETVSGAEKVFLTQQLSLSGKIVLLEVVEFAARKRHRCDARRGIVMASVIDSILEGAEFTQVGWIVIQ